MSWLWLVVSFVAGFLIAWNLGQGVIRRLFRSGPLMVDALERLPQENLLRLQAAVETELDDRRRS